MNWASVANVEGMVKLAIVYYSSYGTAHAMATRMAETAEKAGAEVRLRRVRETAPREVVEGVEAWAAHAASVADQPVAEPDDLAWADAVIMGSGTRYGHVTSQLQAFIDTLGPLWQEGALADKVYAAFTSSATPHGGQESTILAMLTTFCHFGGIIVPPGLNENPYGTSHVLGSDSAPVSEIALQSARVQADRVVRVARALKEV